MKNLPSSLGTLLALALSLAVLSAQPAHAQRAAKKVAVVYFREAPFTTAYVEALERELGPLMGNTPVEVLRPETADGTLETFRANLERVYADRSVNVVVSLGVNAGREIAARETLPKPTILPVAIPELQQLPRDGSTSGRANLTYITGFVDVARDLRELGEVIRYEKVAVLVTQEVTDALPGLAEYVAAGAELNGVTAVMVPLPVERGTADEINAALPSIPEDVDAVYLGALGALEPGGVQAMIDGLIARDLPSFAVNGVQWVEQGVLATATPDEDLVRRQRRVAIFIQRALSGEDLSTFDVTFEPRTELVINMRTARAINAWPRFEVLTEARPLHGSQPPSGPPLTLEAAVREALRTNLDLDVEKRTVTAGQRGVEVARSPLLPRVTGTGGFTWIDPDVAGVGQSERTVSWGLQAQQVLYSPEAWLGFRAEQQQQRAREQGFESARLDTVLQTTIAYLDVLRAQTAERINQENLARARTNLNAAETRVRIGSAGREEVFRWQIEIAQSRAAVIQTSALRNQAEIELNRMMNRELEQPLYLEETDDPREALQVDPRIDEFVDDPWSFRHFRGFMVTEAARNSPEIRQLRAAYAAQTRVLEGRRRSLAPTVALTGGFTHTLGRWGEGAEPASFTIPGAGDFTFPQDDFTWQVGVNLSFALYTGNERLSEIQRAQTNQSQTQLQLRSTMQRVEQRIRSQLHQLGADRANMNLTQDAADAAGRNLALVQDAYRQGTVDIIRLIDAQNQALLNELASANATYDFMASFFRMERAAGRFRIESDSDDVESFFQRARRFMARARSQTDDEPDAPPTEEPNR